MNKKRRSKKVEVIGNSDVNNGFLLVLLPHAQYIVLYMDSRQTIQETG